MKRHRVRYVILGGLCLLWPLFTAAQTPQRQVAIKPFFINTVPDETWYYMSLGQESELRFYPGRIGAVHTYAGGDDLVFYTKTMGPEGELLRTPKAQIHLPDGARDFILIFNHNQEQKQWQVFALPAGEREFPEGAYYLSNLTGDQVVFKFGDEVVSLVPGRFEKIEPNIDKTLATEVFAARHIGGEPRIVYRSQWPNYTGRRNLVLVYNDPGSRRGLLVQRFMETVE